VLLLGVERHDVEACNEGNVAGFGEKKRPIRAYICSLYRADFFVMFVSDKREDLRFGLYSPLRFDYTANAIAKPAELLYRNIESCQQAIYSLLLPERSVVTDSHIVLPCVILV
jgi:hypothetical protein